MNGFEILKEIRRTSNIPVILLTARGADVDRIVGLEMGADDYVPKPFNARGLPARIRAVLRRLEPRPGDRERAIISVDDVSLNPGSRAVLRDGVPVELTTVEFDILRLLLESAGQTVTRERISDRVAVLRAAGERLEDEGVKGAVKERVWRLGRHRRSVYQYPDRLG